MPTCQKFAILWQQVTAGDVPVRIAFLEFCYGGFAPFRLDGQMNETVVSDNSGGVMAIHFKGSLAYEVQSVQ